MKKDTRALVLFIAVAFGLSWSIALAIYLAGGFEAFGPWLSVVLFAYMCGPGLAGILCAFLFQRGRWVAALGLSQPDWKQMPWGWIAGILLLGGALPITIAVPGYELASPVQSLANQLDAASDTMSVSEQTMARAQLEMPFIGIVLLMMSLFLGPAINAFLTLSEELGWRGYLWDMLEPRGFWTATFLIGFLWGVWHMPIIWLGHNYPDAPLFGSFAFILLCILMSPIYSWLRITTKSVWGPGLFHGTTNGAASYFILLQSPQDQPWQGLLGYGGFLAATISTIAIWYVWKRRKNSKRIENRT